MKFICEKSLLAAGLATAGRTVAQKSALPAIEGILCQAGSGVSLTGYNMETAITCLIDAQVSEPGECVLKDVRKFSDIIRHLPEGPVTIGVDENNKVSIRAGLVVYNGSAEPAEDYPELPDVGDGKSIRIPQSALKELIGGTIFAVSENQGRPIHTGVKFEVTPDAVAAVAVDGFRLARRTYHAQESLDREASFVVPAQSLKEVEKILQDGDEAVSFTLGSKHILFQMGSTTLICRLLEGEFLDWRRVVPMESPIQLTAHVEDLAAATELAGLIVSEKYKSPLRCTFGNQELQMRTTTAIDNMKTQCAIAGDGKELEIGFNVRYFMDALRAIPSPEVVLGLTNSLSPIVMTPAEEKYDYIYMVLPVRIA